MKNSTKYLFLFTVVIVLFVTLSAVMLSNSLYDIKTADNQAAAQLVAKIHSQYPDVKEEEIIEVLNGHSDKDTSEILRIFEKYGISENDFTIYANQENVSKAVLFHCLTGMMFGTVLLFVFVLYIKKQKKENDMITDYIRQLNSGNYDLRPDINNETETSLLQNEVYKTTVMLREQSERSQRDKENLKNSLSDISHQLKTPITSILLMLESLIQDPDMPKGVQHEFLSDINRSANNISFLVQSILTLSKLDANTIQMKNQKEKLSDIFNECIQNTEILAELKGVKVRTDYQDEMIECDFKWFTEALSNIVKNCIEYTDKGGEVSISTHRIGNYCKIFIRDNGCGIDREDLPHIFERFYKGKNSGENSVGIGLALSKAIIEKNGAYITCSSELNKGTVFTVTVNAVPTA